MKKNKKFPNVTSSEEREGVLVNPGFTLGAQGWRF